MRIFYRNTKQKKNHQDSSLETIDIQFYVNSKNDCFSQISRNENRNNKVVRVKVISNWVFYSTDV